MRKRGSEAIPISKYHFEILAQEKLPISVMLTHACTVHLCERLDLDDPQIMAKLALCDGKQKNVIEGIFIILKLLVYV